METRGTFFAHCGKAAFKKSISTWKDGRTWIIAIGSLVPGIIGALSKRGFGVRYYIAGSVLLVCGMFLWYFFEEAYSKYRTAVLDGIKVASEKQHSIDNLVAELEHTKALHDLVAKKKMIGDELGTLKLCLANRIAEMISMRAEAYADKCPPKDATTSFDYISDMLIGVIITRLEQDYSKLESAIFQSTAKFLPSHGPPVATPEYRRWKWVIDRLKHYDAQLELIIQTPR